MARNMSFFLTQNQIREGSKTVTRRNGWKFIKAGDIVNACVKCQGLRKGEKIEKIRKIRILSTRWEPLNAIDERDVILEGFPDWTPDDFIQMYCKHNKVDPDGLVNRIEFEYVEEEDAGRALTTDEVNDILNSIANLPSSDPFTNATVFKLNPDNYIITKR